MKKILFLVLLTQSVFAQTDSINVALDTLKNSGNSISIQDVQINATRASSNAPTTFLTLNKAALNKNNLGQDLPILLDNTPSVVTTTDAGAGVGYTGIRIRGSDATRINVSLNGIPVNDAESQGTFWVNLPDLVSSAQSVQIQRGIGASTNGGSSFGGTISVQTQTPNQKAFGEANVSGGSFNTFKVNGKAGTGLVKGFFAEGSGSWITSNGYIDRASSNLRSWFFQTGYFKNKTLVKLLYFGGRQRTYQAWNGVPEDKLATDRTFNDLGTDGGAVATPYNNQTDNYGQDYFQLLFSQNIPANLTLNSGLFATLGRGYYEEFKASENYTDYFETGTAIETDLVRQKWLKNIYYGGTFALTYNLQPVTATLGGALTQYRGQHFGKVVWTEQDVNLNKEAHYYDGNSVKNDMNVYGKLNYEWKQKVNFYLDFQYRYVGYTTAGLDANITSYNFAKKWHFLNPKVGAIVKLKPMHQVYASYALGNREPNRDDVLTAIATNKTVKPEQMHNVEAGYKFLSPSFPITINYYMMYYHNQLVLTGKVNDVGNPVKENVAKSYRTGLELNGSIYIKRKGYKTGSIVPKTVFAINYSFTYSINKVNSFDEYLYTYNENYSPIDSLQQIITHKNSDISFSPNIVASLELVALPITGLEIGLVNKAVSKQYLDNTSNEDRKLKPFFYSNLRVAYTLPLKSERHEIKLTLLFNNIFNRLFESNGYTFSERYAYQDENNQTQVTPAATYNYYYPQAGFNLLGGISARF